MLLFGSSLSDNEHSACIGIVTVEYSGAIHIDYVAFLKYIVLVWNAVAHYFVDTCATALRKTFISQTGRNGMVIHCILIYKIVDFQRTHPCLYHLCHFVEHACVYNTCSTDSLYLFRRLYQVAGRYQMALVLEIHNALIHFGQRLAGNGVPIPFVFILS